MADEPTPNSETETTKTIVVAGDICLDVLGYPIPPAAKRDDSTFTNWQLSGETRTFYRRGGTWLLADFVKGALKQDPQKYDIVQPIANRVKEAEAATAATTASSASAAAKEEEEEEERFLEGLTRHQIVHSLLALKVFTDKLKSKDGCECEMKRIRVSDSHGFSGPKKGNPTLEVTLPDDVPNPTLVILDDTGNRFRNDSTLWPAAITSKDSASTSLVIYKLHRPLPNSGDQGVHKNELWEHVRSKDRNSTIVVVSVDDLREAGAVISRKLSWERTALDVVWQLNGGDGFGRWSELRECPHLIVRLGLEGALYWCNPGNHESPRAWLVYDPTSIEGDWGDQRAGTMVGYGSAFVAGLASKLLANKQLDVSGFPPQIERGIKQGLLASRSLLSIGYEFPAKKDAPPDPKYPVDKVFSEITDEDEAVFATVPVPFSIDLLNADPNHWSILNESLPGGSLIDQAAEMVTKEKRPNNEKHEGKILSKLPRGMFGKLVTYDRSEIEDYRAISNLVREYLGQLAPKRPLCLAVFGPPGSGKSFGVEQVAASIAKQTGATIVKLTFNLSQFSADSDDLSRALHLVRDVVLKGNVPLVFFDEFDSSVGDVEKYWLKLLLAPMQDGEFLDQGAIHPLGRAIFVFAGGTSHSYLKFVPTEKDERGQPTKEWNEFAKAKGPDFVSRLRGVLDIPGIDIEPLKPRAAAALRRASILRFQLLEKARHLFDTVEDLQIDDGVLRAFLNVRRFNHGIRSLEAILDMSQLGGLTRFDAGSLPHPSQMDLHVQARTNLTSIVDLGPGFVDLVIRASPFLHENREKIAQEIHKHYLENRKTRGEYDPTKDTHQEWEKLSELDKDSNRFQADDVPRKLHLIGHRCIDNNSPGSVLPEAKKVEELSNEDIDRLAKSEHDRWCAEHRALGWKEGDKNDANLRTHPSLKDWESLNDAEKEKDRASIRAIPRYLKAGGYAVVK